MGFTGLRSRLAGQLLLGASGKSEFCSRCKFLFILPINSAFSSNISSPTHSNQPFPSNKVLWDSIKYSFCVTVCNLTRTKVVTNKDHPLGCCCFQHGVIRTLTTCCIVWPKPSEVPIFCLPE